MYVCGWWLKCALRVHFWVRGVKGNTARNGGWVEDEDNQLQHCSMGYVFRTALLEWNHSNVLSNWLYFKCGVFQLFCLWCPMCTELLICVGHIQSSSLFLTAYTCSLEWFKMHCLFVHRISGFLSSLWLICLCIVLMVWKDVCKSAFLNNLVMILVSFLKYVKVAHFHFFWYRMIFGVVWFVFVSNYACGIITIL